MGKILLLLGLFSSSFLYSQTKSAFEEYVDSLTATKNEIDTTSVSVGFYTIQYRLKNKYNVELYDLLQINDSILKSKPRTRMPQKGTNLQFETKNNRINDVVVSSKNLYNIIKTKIIALFKDKYIFDVFEPWGNDKKIEVYKDFPQKCSITIDDL